MFGAPMFGQAPFGGLEEYETPRPGTGGGWSHRGPVKLPAPWKPNPRLPGLPKFKKAPYVFFRDPDAD